MSTAPLSKEQRTFGRRIKEARLGDPIAQYEVALMYANGVGVSKSVEQALAWTESAAKKGHTAAQYLLGNAYLGGLGARKDTQQALAWLLKASESGSDKAPLKLARLLSQESQALAQDFLTVAAHRGVAEAQYAVAASVGGADLAGDGLEWLQRAATQGLAPAQFALANALEKQGIEATGGKSAQDWYRLAAAQGHPAAQLALSRWDAEGWGRKLGGKSTARRASTRERRVTDYRIDRYAAKGEPDDQYHLGLIYLQGVGVDKSPKLAIQWWTRAAQSGHLQAQIALGDVLQPNAPSEANTWYRLAAAQGSVHAHRMLGQNFFAGLGQAPSMIQAMFSYAAAASQGDAQASQGLAEVLAHHKNDVVADLESVAARGGVAQAQFELGLRFATGDQVEQDWRKAVEWYRRAAEQGLSDAQCALGDCYVGGLGVRKDRERAAAVYEQAASQGHLRAQWCLGELLAQGVGGLEPDPKKAALWCRRAADGGFAPAQSTLASILAQAKKYDRAVGWWRLAAEQSDPEALFNLAHAYRMGWVPPSQDSAEEAFMLLLRAAQTGLAAAQARLGLAYATGEGAALDPIEAAKWFTLAAQRGDASAKANSMHAEKTLSPAQWREAQRRARSWKPGE